MQDVSSKFKTVAGSTTRRPKQKISFAWERTEPASVSFFTIGTSTIGGPDIIKGEFDAITPNDLFTYTDETNYTLSYVVDRKYLEPFGGVSYSIGDIVISNTTGRFTPGSDPVIGDYVNKPNRPIKILGGFRFDSQNRYIPLMYGLTDDPKEDKRSRTIKMEVNDYIGEIDEYKLESDTIYTDQRSDQIIADILDTIGFNSNQYSLDTGLNTIGFAWFPKNTSAGSAIRAICQAEEGHFYQTELGEIRFDNRRKVLETTYQTSQLTISRSLILDFEEMDKGDIINRCTVRASPRVVQDTTEIWRLGASLELAAKEEATVWISFDNPANAITNPASTTDYVANTDSDGSGTDVTSSLGVSIDKFVQSAKLTLTNNTNAPMYVTTLRLRGDPATITAEIEEIYEDTTSQDEYGVKAVEIENDFIDSESFAYYIARSIVRQYSSPRRRIRVLIPAQPHLQLLDKVTLEVKDGTNESYRVMRIQSIFNNGGFLQWVTLREITGLEALSPFIIGTSTIGGDDVIWI